MKHLEENRDSCIEAAHFVLDTTQDNISALVSLYEDFSQKDVDDKDDHYCPVRCVV